MVARDRAGVLTWRAEDVGIQVPPSQPAGHLLLVPREPTGRDPARADWLHCIALLEAFADRCWTQLLLQLGVPIVSR